MNSLHLLEKTDKQKGWLAVLREYCTHLSKENMEELADEGMKLPFCGNCAEFRKHFDWIRTKLAQIRKLRGTENLINSGPTFSIYGDED